MGWQEWMYYVTFLIGLVYAIVTFILGNIGGGGEGHDVAGHDAGGGHEGAGHDTGAVHAPGHEVHFSPFSPIVISMFLSSFGGMGILCLKMFNIPIEDVWKHLPLSLAGGLLGGGGTFTFFWKIFRVAQGSVLPSQKDIVGLEAQVITAIPGHEQLGEVAYVAKGVRTNAPARSEDGTQIPAQSVVVITKIVGGTYYVKAVRK
jgi:hypothetical protein